MGDSSMDGSFRIYVDPECQEDGVEAFSSEVENVKQDLIDMEKLYASLQQCNQDMKEAGSGRAMRDVRERLNSDLDNLEKLVKQINKKYEGLVRANAAQRKGSSDDDRRESMISDLVETLQSIMRAFQTLRTQMETDNRVLIEARFYAITHEKATAEAIDNLIASDAAGSPLHHAIQKHGKDPVAEAVEEIKERREAMREIRRSLMALHQVLLGIATPAAAQQGGGNKAGGDIACVVESFPAAGQPSAAALGGGKGGAGGLNDYERETRNRAYIAIAVAVILVVAISITFLRLEIMVESKIE